MVGVSRRRLLSCGVGCCLVGTSLLGGCAHQDASALAAQACASVRHGIALYDRASTTSGATAQHFEAQALAAVRAAVPLAAIAAGEDTTWQALSANLSESNRVPLANLVPALQDQCAAAG